MKKHPFIIFFLAHSKFFTYLSLFLVTTLMIILVFNFIHSDNSVKNQSKTSESGLWVIPDTNTLDNSENSQLIRYGKELVIHTSFYLGPNGIVSHSTNGMNCQNCHLWAGTKMFGNNYSAVASTYPKFRERSGGMEDIYKRVNDCVERSLNGAELDTASREMQAIKAYIIWLGTNVKKGAKPFGSGITDLPYLERAADPENGKVVYKQICQTCHGENGDGKWKADSGYVFPPLWGPHSFTIGAGLYRLSRFAGYVRSNMPFGTNYDAPKLGDEEAWDVAAYVNSQQRPSKDLSKDWPHLSGKPIDHPFGPYEDTFTERQHKYGPFGPIEVFIKQKKIKPQRVLMSDKEIKHHSVCSCGSCHTPTSGHGFSRKDFLKTLGATAIGLGIAPVSAFALQEEGKASEILKSKSLLSGKAQRITLLHTTDIHGQVNVHDEFFWEEGKAVFKKRGGFAHLKTMINQLRQQNPNTLLLDGGDCFQGSAIAALSEGAALIPLMNDINYDLMLPGNWEVVYGKKMLLKDMGAYHAPKVCANMFHAEKNEMIFPPYHTFFIGGLKIGFVGYNDPLTPIRQSPAYSNGLKFTEPEKNIAHYVKLLREQEQCDMVFALTHMGLAQQLNLANQPYASGIDYILGADTHERIREPLKGKYSKVTEPGAFASFIGKLDIIVEDGKIKDEVYELLEVDPEKYPADEEMVQLLEKAHEPYNKEIKRVIGKTKTPLMRYFVIETPMDNLITDALMWKSKPDIALSNGFRFCPPLVPDEKTGEAEITNEYLWSMLPVNSDVKMADVTGKQIWDWLERELENVFAKDPTRRLGGWLIRFQGMKIKFTIEKSIGERLLEVKVHDKPIDLMATYSILACEREGDPDSLLCRVKDVKNARRLGFKLHDVMEEYLAAHSLVAPKIEGRAVATDAPSTLLTQVEGVNYQFK